jgi:putative endonuclease
MRHALNGKPTHIKDDSVDRQTVLYLLTNRAHGTLYIGVTSDLAKRVWQHKNKVVRGFANKYDLIRPFYF